ncbi:MAG: anhydro-N-acetylmuramic acid kinase [Hyphomicrobium sp.]
MSKTLRALGLMSGTSMDGISVALIDTDGEDNVVRGPSQVFPYNSSERQAISTAMAEARHLENRFSRTDILANVEEMITKLHAIAVQNFIYTQKLSLDEIDVVGFHGQTVLHRPERSLTAQLGDGPFLSELTGLKVVYDLRARDVAAGGQGAPLVPVYHRALVSRLNKEPLVLLNIGGVANITFIACDGDMLAFDTGPGNALIDDWMMKKVGYPYDPEGQTAAKGTINEDVVRFFLSNPFFQKPPPKSLDRNAFDENAYEWMSLEDGAATLTAFTCEAIAKAQEYLPESPKIWITCGGGRKNSFLIKKLSERVSGSVLVAENFGLDGDSVEAEAWGYLAVRALKGLPITFPGTTGVDKPLSGGVVCVPKS